MKPKVFILLGLLLAGLYWIVESYIHSAVFHQGDFVHNLSSGSPNEIWMRLVIAVLFISFGSITQYLHDQRVKLVTRHSNEQLKKMVDSSPEAIAIVLEHKITYPNSAFAHLVGATDPQELTGTELLSLVCPNERDYVNEQIKQIVTEKKSPRHIESKLTRLNTAPFLAEITALPVEFDNAYAVMVLVRDINERRRWELELQASLERTETALKRERAQSKLLERFYQHTLDCIVLLDRNFNFVQVNQAYARSCGREVDEFPGHNHFDFYPSPIIEDFKQVVSTGVRYSASARPFVFPDHPEWGETYWDLSLVPIHNESGEVDILLFTLMDVTKRHMAEVALSKINRELLIVSACDSLMVHSSDESSLLDSMTHMIVDKNRYCTAWVGYAVQDAQKTLSIQTYAGDGINFFEKAQFSWGDNELGRAPSGTAIRTSQTVVIHDIKETECRPWCTYAMECGYASCISLPLRNGENVFGVLSIYSQELNAFAGDEVKLLEQLADDLSFGICNIRSNLARRNAEEKIATYVQQLEESMQGTLQAVSNMVEQRDPYTAGHERRVGIIASDIAREMEWPAEKCNSLKLIGLVHDIGKIAIPSEILTKPGWLTPLEYEVVKCHVEKGYEILKDVNFPLPIAEIIRQHHEHMDGSGYPRGLKGHEILPEARIIAVSDVLESMSSHRPYRPAKGVEAALKEIVDHRNTFYDACVVDTLIQMVKEKGYQLPS